MGYSPWGLKIQGEGPRIGLTLVSQVMELVSRDGMVWWGRQVVLGKVFQLLFFLLLKKGSDSPLGGLAKDMNGQRITDS